MFHFYLEYAKKYLFVGYSYASGHTSHEKYERIIEIILNAKVEIHTVFYCGIFNPVSSRPFKTVELTGLHKSGRSSNQNYYDDIGGIIPLRTEFVSHCK